MPSRTPMLLEASPPRQSAIIPTSQAIELYQNAKSRLCNPLYNHRSTRLSRWISASTWLISGST